MGIRINSKFNFRDFMPKHYQFLGALLSAREKIIIWPIFSIEGVHNGVLYQIKLKVDQKGHKMNQKGLKYMKKGFLDQKYLFF